MRTFSVLQGSIKVNLTFIEANVLIPVNALTTILYSPAYSAVVGMIYFKIFPSILKIPTSFVFSVVPASSLDN